MDQFNGRDIRLDKVTNLEKQVPVDRAMRQYPPVRKVFVKRSNLHSTENRMPVGLGSIVRILADHMAISWPVTPSERPRPLRRHAGHAGYLSTFGQETTFGGPATKSLWSANKRSTVERAERAGADGDQISRPFAFPTHHVAFRCRMGIPAHASAFAFLPPRAMLSGVPSDASNWLASSRQRPANSRAPSASSGESRTCATLFSMSSCDQPRE